MKFFHKEQLMKAVRGEDDLISEIDRSSPAHVPGESFPDEIMPGTQEIIPETHPGKQKPRDRSYEIQKINDEEKEEIKRRERIHEIIRKRDEPKKKIH
jgi:hypothetical protein